MKRFLAMLLSFVMLITSVPAFTVMAATTDDGYRFVLDTDGIDQGEEYIIASASAGNGSVLKFDPLTPWQEASQSVVIENNTIAAFERDAYVTWTFSGSASGTVSAHNYYLCIMSGEVHFDIDSRTLNFASLGDGKYSITAEVEDGSVIYLDYVDNTWVATQNQSEGVYLYKKEAYPNATYSVAYSGNGSTGGKVPEATAGLKKGSVYTVQAPQDLVRVESGAEYIFEGWNTQPDGTGTDYAPGELLVLKNYNVTLYAKWYLRYQKEVIVNTFLDGEIAELDTIVGSDVTLYVKEQDSDAGYVELAQKQTGRYVTPVSENGTYDLYYKVAGSDSYNQLSGYSVVVYNQNREINLNFYSINYDLDTESTGEEWNGWYLVGNTVRITQNIPERTGYKFAGWKAEDGHILQSGAVVNHSITGAFNLTALWTKMIDVTVDIVIEHNTEYGHDTSDSKDDVTFQLYQYMDNGYNYPVGERIVLDSTTPDVNYAYDAEKDITTYSYTFKDLPDGVYHVATVKSGYEENHTALTNGKIEITYSCDTRYFDMRFDVQIKNAPYPKTVNVKVLYWGTDGDATGWHIIPTQKDGGAPIEVTIDQDTGKGSSSLSLWKYLDHAAERSVENAYKYRVVVSSYIMPDGTLVPITSNEGSLYETSVSVNNLYTGVFSVEGGGAAPSGDTATLLGSYFDGTKQNGVPIITVTAANHSVTFNPGVNATINGNETQKLEYQYAYPDLDSYVPVLKDAASGQYFVGWDANGDGAADENLNGQLLTGSVTYKAIWRAPFVVTGTVQVDGTYQLNEETVEINPVDKAKKALVVLQKSIDGEYYAVAEQEIAFPEDYVEKGEATYRLSVPYEEGLYRIQVIVLNYDSTFDGIDEDTVYTAEEAILNASTEEQTVNAHLAFVPNSYSQMSLINVGQISESYRPTKVEARIQYRNLGDSTPYADISQHENGGMDVTFDGAGSAVALYDVWKWHTDGSLYEYQLNIPKLYGNIAGVFDGITAYDAEKSPYIINYGISAWWNNAIAGETNPLQATLIPKTYNITFDLGLTDAEKENVIPGMEHFVSGESDKEITYTYRHTWSYQDKLTAFPYRAGYVFRGWTSSDNQSVYIHNNGNITIAAGLSKNITLTANWEEIDLTKPVYAVRYLEFGSNDVLHQAEIHTDVQAGDQIAVDSVHKEISGYSVSKVKIGNGELVDFYTNPTLTVQSAANNVLNLITLYYTPNDEGFTEDIESNLHLDKNATLEDDGTYSITMETFTMDDPITTQIKQNTPLDIVMVLDQSGSIYQSGYLDDLQDAVDNFVELIAEHGRVNEIDHRIAMVGYASDEITSATSSDYPFADNVQNAESKWINTGVFDSNGDFHPYTVTGFNYTGYTGEIDTDGTYYTKSGDEYLLLMYHDKYYHLIDEEQAKTELLNNPDKEIYGYADHGFVRLTRNLSGLWLYGDNNEKLYSSKEFFTYHEKVWTHRSGLKGREIHGYHEGNSIKTVDGHEGVYVRTDTEDANPQLNVYKDALNPVSVGAKGSGSTNPGLLDAKSHLGSNGGTYVQYGIKMANKIFEANPEGAPGNPEGRVRIMVMFTDGLPGTGTFDKAEANAAIDAANTAKNTHGAYSYAIGLYTSNGVKSDEGISIYMNALSSNYEDVTIMDEVYPVSGQYVSAAGRKINDGRTYYAGITSGYLWNQTTNYYEIKYGQAGNQFGWYYTRGNSNTLLTTDQNAIVGTNGRINYTNIYYQLGSYDLNEGDPDKGYYSTTDSEQNLKEYFSHVVTEITTNITREVVLHQDTILRDIMGEGFELAPGAVITAYKQAGTYNSQTGGIDWAEDEDGNPVLDKLASYTLPNERDPELAKDTVLLSDEKATWTDPITKEEHTSAYIQVYNWYQDNSLVPDDPNYHPHTIDITGYDFSEWYINETKTTGFKLYVTISQVEACDNVDWNVSTLTNHEQSGLWLPKDVTGNRELLAAFDQPNTIFVERAYVLDYAKPFTLSGWALDKAAGAENAGAIHLDATITQTSDVTYDAGMNQFTVTAPTKSTGEALNYGQATISDGVVTYKPTTMQWKGVEEFYVFGETANKAILSQDANENGNVWTKVKVMPANNVYYEDSFVTVTDSTNNKNVDGFNFKGSWETVYDEGQGSTSADQNTEHPEHMESDPYGDVHGWTDDLANDNKFTDGSAHVTGLNKERGAKVEFTFTGTGVDIYTRTNDKSGMVVATLKQLVETVDENGTLITNEVSKPGIMMDNLAMSGDYYQVPTISFHNLEYGTYKVTLIATSASKVATGSERYEYYLDGIRVYNPMNVVGANSSEDVKDAYGAEKNAVFTEIRDVLLKPEDFDASIGGDGTGTGAVFIDWVQKEQQEGLEEDAVGQPSYDLGIFEEYGPKNEVYLSSGQSIVLKVDPKNTYYVGMKSLNGNTVTAAYSGVNTASVTEIDIQHSTDLYYQVVPVDGFIVISNASEENDTNAPVLSITKLRTTNATEVVENYGILPVEKQEALMAMSSFALRMNQQQPEEPDASVEPEEPTVPETPENPEGTTGTELPEEIRGTFTRMNPVAGTKKYKDNIVDFWSDILDKLFDVLGGE